MSIQDLRFTSNAIKQELLRTQKSYFDEFHLLGTFLVEKLSAWIVSDNSSYELFPCSEVNLKALADAAGNYCEVLNENRKLFNEIQDLKGAYK